MADFVGALDQGTTSTRCIIFDRFGAVVSMHQEELEQILPRPGWVEHDPLEIWRSARDAIVTALGRARLRASDLAAIGIANQRETTVVWDRRTGRPYANAVVWQDTRSDAIVAELESSGAGDVIRERAGIPPAAYFSAGKLRWLLENVRGLRDEAVGGNALFGTIDTWLVWNLTGGPDGGRHLTDVTNASRTMLMGLEALDWDDELLSLFDIPRSMLPEIGPSSDPLRYGRASAVPSDYAVPISGVIGDQQAAMLGQVCFAPGETKATYGTGSFLLVNTGPDVVRSCAGLLSTVAFQRAGGAATYALEGSIAVTGSAVQWLRDQLGIIGDAHESEALARQVNDSGGVYFVPAFSGLLAPHWRSDARGAIVGLSRFNSSAHLARATLEAICYQTRDVVESIERDCSIRLPELRVDGGVATNDLCMQIQADVLGVPVVRPAIIETTALGAAYAAGLAIGFWHDPDELRRHWRAGQRWEPEWSPERRDGAYHGWRKAVQRALDWVEVE